MTQSMERAAVRISAWVFGWTILLLAGCGAETGSGQACSTVDDCPAATSECGKPTCLGGFCGVRETANGSDAPTQKDGDCRKNLCAGGDSIVVEDSADVPADDGTKCTLEACALGAAATSNAAAGTACDDAEGVVCDGAGSCVKCVTDAECAATEVCNAKHECVSAQCKDGVKDGDETDVDCGGSCGTTCGQGEACAAAKDCVSAQCTDGVCCNSACDGECEACAAAKTGKADGTCAPMPAGMDPDSECEAEPAVACGNTDGQCSGLSHCNKVAAGTACGAGATCTNDVATTGDACDGAGTCAPDPGTSCAPYGCGATECKTMCASDADCSAGSFCQGSVCMPAGDPGDPCATAAWCKSGFCADGVCCDTACDGTCEACVALKKEAGDDGACGPVKPGTNPDSECAGADVCNAASLCKAPGGAACASAAECASGFCTDGVCCDALCNAVCQSCLAAQTGGALDGVCGPVMGGIDPAAECAGAMVCNGMSACAKLSNGAACAAGGDCTSGFCADGLCCNNACSGACEACSASKKSNGVNGVCGTISSGKDPDNECIGDTACGGNGVCSSFSIGTSCGQAGECASGFCVDGVCCNSPCATGCQACSTAKRGAGAINGQCGAIAAGTDPDDECAGALVCDAAGACKLLNAEPCAANGDCVSGFCADGVCCNTACSSACAACTNAKKGSGPNGVCGNIPSNQDPDNECAGATTCNGNAACATFATGQACTLATECASGFCVDNVCCNSACATGCQACSAVKRGGGATNGQCGAITAGTDPDDECAGALVCDAAGACKLLNAEPCAANGDCVSGFCADGVCCNTACSGSCSACSLAKKGFGSDGVCGNILNGLDPDNECGGATVCNGSAACALLPAGLSCSANNECQSVACVDGFCCNSACSNTCEACSAAKKGSGSNGVCGAITSGADPDSECAGPLVCNGSGLCKAPSGGACASNTDCLGNICVDGVCCNTLCNSLCQACTAARKGSGADGICGNVAVNTDPDSECPGATTCNGSACALFANGSACTLNAECSGGQCVDGFCCNTTCTGLCQACSAAKKGSGADGTCGPIGAGTDPDDECAGALNCSGAGVCN